MRRAWIRRPAAPGAPLGEAVAADRADGVLRCAFASLAAGKPGFAAAQALELPGSAKAPPRESAEPWPLHQKFSLRSFLSLPACPRGNFRAGDLCEVAEPRAAILRIEWLKALKISAWSSKLKPPWARKLSKWHLEVSGDRRPESKRLPLRAGDRP